MKKISLIATVMIFALSSVAFASPLTDFSQGKVAVDINFRPDADITCSGSLTGSVKGKNDNIDLGATIALGNKFAFQYKNSNQKTKDHSLTLTNPPLTINVARTEIEAQEYNILYKIDKGFAAFAGITNAKASITGISNPVSYPGKSISGYQVGIIGNTPIGKNLNAYGIIGVGDKITSFEFGVGYEIAKNTELNLFYKDAKYKDLEVQTLNGKSDATVKGMGYGLTFKF